MFVSINPKFLEKKYIICNRVKRDIDWKTLENTPTLTQGTMGPEIPTPTILVSSSTLVPCHNGRVFIWPYRFMYLGKSFEAIPEEHETDAIDYNEVMSSDDVVLRQGAMKGAQVCDAGLQEGFTTL